MSPAFNRLLKSFSMPASLNVCPAMVDLRGCLCADVFLEGVDGPILYGTKAENVRFHDDKSLYTGVHKHGGPTTVDDGRVQFDDLSKFCDRSEYDIRGVKKGIMEQKTGDSK